MTGSISSTTIYFAWIFTGESTATMSSLSTISVHNDLTSGESCISMRATDHKLTGRIHMIDNMVIEQSKNLRMINRSNDTRHQHLNHIFPDHCQHLFISLQLGSGRIISR